MTAFVIGNGKSREGMDLNDLKKHGMTYGCNALYREFTPDVLVAKDKPISDAIQESGYALKNRFYTRMITPDSGARMLELPWQNFNSGTNALHIATTEDHNVIYLLGFDLGTVTKLVNNYYADTRHYKKSDRAFSKLHGKIWLEQFITVMTEHPDIKFIRVIIEHSKTYDQLLKVKNLTEVDIDEFLKQINNR